MMLDADLAVLYGVTTGALNRAVIRNPGRFPPDFMFQLTEAEARILKCQIGISSLRHGGRRRSLPYAFTEQGVAMLSSVLRSERAVQVNVTIMRAFVSLRRMLASNDTLARKLSELECHLEGHDQAIKSLFNAIRELAAPTVKPRREIGFHVKEASAPHRVKRRCVSPVLFEPPVANSGPSSPTLRRCALHGRVTADRPDSSSRPSRLCVNPRSSTINLNSAVEAPGPGSCERERVDAASTAEFRINP